MEIVISSCILWVFGVAVIMLIASLEKSDIK